MTNKDIRIEECQKKKQQGKFKRKEAGLAKWYKINAKGILGLMRHMSLTHCLLSYRKLTRT